MQLTELSGYDEITIQCHDNPDADTLASAFALYSYFQSLGKRSRMIYAGRNRIQKANLKLMVEKLNIPVEYVEDVNAYENCLPNHKVQGLLLTVDCQYGAGNVTRIAAENVAIIDHHQVEITNVEKSEINPQLGSCSTLA